MTTTPKTKDELILENALLIQRNAISEDMKKTLKEALEPITTKQTNQDDEINSIKERLDGIWLKIWAVSGTMSAICGAIGFCIGLIFK